MCARVEIRGQLVGLSTFLITCRLPGSNSGPQVWQQVLLPAWPSNASSFYWSESRLSPLKLKTLALSLSGISCKLFCSGWEEGPLGMGGCTRRELEKGGQERRKGRWTRPMHDIRMHGMSVWSSLVCTFNVNKLTLLYLKSIWFFVSYSNACIVASFSFSRPSHAYFSQFMVFKCTLCSRKQVDSLSHLIMSPSRFPNFFSWWL